MDTTTATPITSHSSVAVTTGEGAWPNPAMMRSHQVPAASAAVRFSKGAAAVAVGCMKGLGLSGGMGDAVRSPRPGLEPALGDGSATDVADAVAALVHPQQRGLDLCEALAALGHEGRGLGELEGDGRTLG